MSVGPTRPPTRPETEFIAEVLRRLYDHFPEWHKYGYEGHEHSLAGFAYYEGCGDSGCCGDILAEAAPFALGKELVARHGFRWVMLASGDAWRYGVAHPALGEPIDLLSLEDGSWDDTEREYGGPPARGETTNDSLETIIKRVEQLSRGA